MTDFIHRFIYEFFEKGILYLQQGDYGIGTINVVSGVVICAVVFGIILYAVYGLAHLLFNRNVYSEEKTTPAKVVKCSFVPEHGGTHVVPVFTSNGFGTAVTSDYEEEHDIVVMKSEEIGRIEIDNKELLETVEKGENVHVTYQEKHSYWVWDAANKTDEGFVAVKVQTKDGTEIDV